MKQIVLAFIYFTGLSFITNAQEKEISTKTNFYSTISAGYVMGESGVFPGVQISSGISFKDFKISVGGGYDGYLFKSFPIFAGISRDFDKKKKLFGFINGGYHFPKSEKNNVWSNPETEGGLYADAGLGFRIKLGKKNNLLLSSSYNYKRVRQFNTYIYQCITYPCPVNKTMSDYSLNYLSMRLGWEINY